MRVRRQHGADRRAGLPARSRCALIDAFWLARAQFGFTVAFHIVFPAFSIGLASYLMVLEALWLRTGKQVYLDLFSYWIKIFSIGFAMGVVSGPGDVLPVRHQLVALCRQGGPGDRAGDGLRGDDRVLPGGRFPWRDAVRHGARRAQAAHVRHLHGGGRHVPVGVLDPLGQQLDADARRVRHRPGRARCSPPITGR